MKDLMGLMSKAKEMQARMAELQEEVEAMEVAGASGGGLVSVTLSGKGDLKGLSIDPSLMKEGEGEILEDLIVAAHADARMKLETAMAEKTQSMTAGLGLPPGMGGGKFPFG
ncbi:YbaB/EbfC family nucleoid-associated protein [Notoacmeibacter marinus]|uniref:Nucleoid-associated protein B7H23_02215 n=1 Tax=Notoacmeibacter marinus TaxID=1876515 RepID=A0A231V175_9HYPH|nr:YbaB/EbfC family nucleoid-associated protein [Notoacmeibacter marinus]OXT01791.1 YbaB/EbfC family nucleoid-associated protein [Notoacmeibacter marinus]